MIMEKKGERLGVVVAVGNQKGGVAKSTNTVHLATALGEMGFQNLIIDLDPSAGATHHLGIPDKSFAGTLELIIDNEDPCQLAVKENLPKGVHLIPSRVQLAELHKYLSKFKERTLILARGLDLARPHYDFIWLDTPPNPGADTTIAAYASADWFLLSTLPHAMSFYGLNEALEDIADVRREINPKLEILGVVISAADKRTKAAARTEQLIVENFPDRAFKTVISSAIAVAEIAGKGKTLFQSKKFRKHPVVEQYRALANEIKARVLNREVFLAGKLKAEEPPLDEQPTVEHSDLDAEETALPTATANE